MPVLVLALALAGLAGGVDVKVNQDLSGQPQNETSLAVNPRDPLNLVGSANDFRTGRLQPGHYTSFDGGKKWVGGVFPIKAGFVYAGDACVAFDDLGNAYEAAMQYYSAAGSALYLYRSADGGAHWDSGTLIDIDPTDDKPAIAVDLSGGPYHGRVTVTWWRVGTASGDHIYVSSSADQGASWSMPQRINDATSVHAVAPDVAVGAGSAIYVMWADRLLHRIYVDRSFDGGAHWGNDILISAYDQVPSPLPGSSFQFTDVFTLAADQSHGPYHGNVYVAWYGWQTVPSPNADILLSRSTDDGATWSAPLRVNDDGTAADQIYPWLDVDPNGNCNVMFYDRRDDPGNYLIHTYVARSSDGGASFFRNQRVSDVAWDHAGDFGGQFIGDYNGMACSAAAVHPFWTDARSGKQDVYVDAVHLNFFSDVDSISASAGGKATFEIDPGPRYGHASYWMFGSATGDSPGSDLGHGVTLPLVVDPFFLLTITSANAGGFVNTRGQLDGTGSSTAMLDTGGPLPPLVVGTRLWFATLVMDPRPLFATNSSTIDLVP